MNQSTAVRSSRFFVGFLFLLGAGGCLSVAAPAAFAAADTQSCSANPESRQMDFWLGQWVVTYPGMSGGSVSKVDLSLDQCLIVETWDGGKGHKGENMFAYSSDDKSWHGMFADNQGRVHVFEGKVSQGSAEFTGPSRGPNGEAVLNRIKIVRLSPDQVEQSWEKSTDNGATWRTEFRGEYIRKKS
jgi:hypothetical protein